MKITNQKLNTKPLIQFSTVMFIMILTSNILLPRNIGGEIEYRNALKHRETMIDNVKEKYTAYLLVSSEGRRDYGDRLLVLQLKEGNWIRSYENDFQELRPWKIELADVDGDGTQEILTAVYKTAHYDNELKNRLFVFNYENGILTKKWTGSQFDGEWIDFYTGDLLAIPGNELIFIEQTEDGKERLSVYYWFDFGFMKLADSDYYKEIQSLSIIDENCIEIICDKKQRITLAVKYGKMIEVTSGE